MLRANCYIDGFNLYYGLKSAGFKRFYWLDLVALARSLLPANHRLAVTKYFTAPVRGGTPSDDPGRAKARDANRRRQGVYLDALATLPGLRRFDGHYLLRPFRCPTCKEVSSCDEEKMTDVQIATELLVDAFQDSFDTAILVSADSDLVPPIRQIRRLFSGKRIIVAFPPKRQSYELTQVAHMIKPIWRTTLKACQLPNPVVCSDGRSINRPAEWV